MAEYIPTQIVRNGVQGHDNLYVRCPVDTDHTLEGNDGRMFMHFHRLTGTGDFGVTITTQIEVSGLDVDDITATLTNPNSDLYIGPFDPQLFNDSSNDVTFRVARTTPGDANSTVGIRTFRL